MLWAFKLCQGRSKRDVSDFCRKYCILADEIISFDAVLKEKSAWIKGFFGVVVLPKFDLRDHFYCLKNFNILKLYSQNKK